MCADEYTSMRDGFRLAVNDSCRLCCAGEDGQCRPLAIQLPLGASCMNFTGSCHYTENPVGINCLEYPENVTENPCKGQTPPYNWTAFALTYVDQSEGAAIGNVGGTTDLVEAKADGEMLLSMAKVIGVLCLLVVAIGWAP